MKKDVLKRMEGALNKFVRKYEKDPNVIGIFATGSYIHSKPDKNSDIDTYVLLKDSMTRERGNTWINGIEIEYFMNPVNQVRFYFKDEFKSGRMATAHMFANSLVLHKKGRELDVLIKEAKAILKKKLPVMKKFAVENAKYFLDDIRKDVEDVYINKDWFDFNILSSSLLEKCLEVFYAAKKVDKEKTKRLKAKLKKHDPKFEKLFSVAVLEKDYTKRFKAINKLTDYTEKLVGGRRTREWRLKGKLTI